MSTASTTWQSWVKVVTTLGVTGAQAIAFVAVFEILRNVPRFARFFVQRKDRCPTRCLPEPSRFPMKWIIDDFRVPDTTVVEVAGMDAYIFLRFLRMWFIITAMSLPFACALTAMYAHFSMRAGFAPADYASLTMANVPSGSIYLTVPLVYYAGFMALVSMLLWREWEEFVPLRQKFLSFGDRDSPEDFRYTILVENIPEKYRSNRALFEHFERLFPGQVKSANVCLNVQSLERILQKRTALFESLEKSVVNFRHLPLERPKVSKRRAGSKLQRESVDAIGHYTQELAGVERLASAEHLRLMRFMMHLNTVSDPSQYQPSKSLFGSFKLGGRSSSKGGSDGAYKALKDGAEGDDAAQQEAPENFSETFHQLVSTSGFVSFNSLSAKHLALQAELSGRVGYLDTFPAPEPEDILWDNITVPLARQETTRVLSNAVWAVGVLFWTIPVAFVQAVSNLNTLATVFGIWTPDPSTALYGFLSGFLPVVALQVLTAIVPLAVKAAATKWIKMKSNSLVDVYTFKWHFGFQVANLWLILLGGSLFSQLDVFVSQPEAVFETIAAAVPGASQFFLMSTITNCGSVIITLCVLGPIIGAIVNGVLQPVKTQREANKLRVPPSFQWGWVYPPVILNVFVLVAYAYMVPVIQLACMIFFGLSYVAYKHLVLHVYVRQSEGGGSLWYTLFSMVMGCLYMSHGIIAAYMSLKKGVYQAPACVVLLGLTVMFHRRVNRYFVQPSTTLPLELSRRIDSRTGGGRTEVAFSSATSPTEQSEQLNEQSYAQPPLRRGLWDSLMHGMEEGDDRIKHHHLYNTKAIRAYALLHFVAFLVCIAAAPKVIAVLIQPDVLADVLAANAINFTFKCLGVFSLQVAMVVWFFTAEPACPALHAHVIMALVAIAIGTFNLFEAHAGGLSQVRDRTTASNALVWTWAAVNTIFGLWFLLVASKLARARKLFSKQNEPSKVDNELL